MGKRRIPLANRRRWNKTIPKNGLARGTSKSIRTDYSKLSRKRRRERQMHRMKMKDQPKRKRVVSKWAVMTLLRKNLVCIISTFAQHYSHQFLAEAYRMTRRMQQDPMANYVDQED